MKNIELHHFCFGEKIVWKGGSGLQDLDIVDPLNKLFHNVMYILTK
jgi:hypothetical protein